jgi:hypothetical protein
MKIAIIDAKKKPVWMFWRPEPWYHAAGILGDLLNIFDMVFYVDTPQEAMDVIKKWKPHHVQFLGHGRSGQPLIGGKPILPTASEWKFVEHAIVWFRMCSVAQGKAGIAFMEHMANRGISVVAHVAKINGSAHSLMYGLKPVYLHKAKAYWSPKLKAVTSNPLRPRSVASFEPNVPDWAWDKDKDTSK